eukprot:6741837-Prorocentrum_lima.AAC.1
MLQPTQTPPTAPSSRATSRGLCDRGEWQSESPRQNWAKPLPVTAIIKGSEDCLSSPGCTSRSSQ